MGGKNGFFVAVAESDIEMMNWIKMNGNPSRSKKGGWL